MREIPGSVVRPTVSDSMLKARRRNTSATRFRTPGLSSTRAIESVMHELSVTYTGDASRAGRSRAASVTDTIHDQIGSAAVSTSTDGSGRRIIASRSAPAGTIGYTLSSCSTRKSMSTVPSACARTRHDIVDLGTLLGAKPQQAVRLGNLHEVRDCAAAWPRTAARRRTPATAAPCRGYPLLMTATLTLTPSCAAVRQLRLRHLEAAVPDDRPDLRIGPRHLGADGRRQTEAHRAEPARRDERARILVMVVLRFPHLVLADVGDDDRLALGHPPDVVDHVRRVEVAVVRQRLNVSDRRIALHGADVLQPWPVIGPADELEQLPQRLSQVGHDRGIGR